MKFTVEDQSAIKKVLHFEVPRETVVSELDSAYQELKKTAKVKGFRPGKTPRGVLERMYRKDVNADVSARLIQNSFIEAVKEADLKIVGNPKIDPPELVDNSAFLFNAEVEVHPEIADIDYKGLEIKKTSHVISDAEIDAQLNMLRTNMAKRNKVEQERPTRTGDVVVIDYEGFKDGKIHEDTRKTENFVTRIGEGQVIEDLDAGLRGMQVGEEKEIDVNFPSDYYNKNLAGQKLLFKVKLNEIREEILPELNDEFAKSVGDRFDSLDALKVQIRKNLQDGYDKRVEQEINEQVFSQLLAKTDFLVPESMVDSELEHIISDAEQKFAQSNRTLEDLGLSREKLAERYRTTAEKQVRRHLILSKLMEQEKLALSDQELEQGMREMAAAYQQSFDFIKGFYDQNKDGLAFFKHTLLEKKALKLIIDSGRVTEVDDTQVPAKPSETSGEPAVRDQAAGEPA